MILLSNKETIGFNPFFPLLIGEKHKKMQVVEWHSYRRNVPLFITINSVLASFFAYVLHDPAMPAASTVLTLATLLQFAYIVLRLKFGRRMTVLDGTAGLEKVAAPYTVWLDYISMGTMFVLMASVSYARTDSDAMRVVFMVIKIFFLVYAFLPMLNFLKYKKYL